MRRFIRELRRREVFRTAGLYVGVSWIVIEVASVLLPTFGAPDWMLRGLVITTFVGFPIAVVLSWIYDVTEQGIVVQPDADDEPVPPFGGRKTDFIVIGILSVALVLSLYMQIRGGAEAPAQLEPVSVLIADFDNRTGDSVFDGSLEQALQIGIEGASFVTSYRREAAEQIAKQIGAASKLDAEAARLVAVREGIKLVLAGSIVADGDGYDIEVRAVEPRNGEVVAEADAATGSKVQVLTAIERIANDLREQLGDESVGRDAADAETYTARSLEAVREYDLAQSLQQGGKLEEAIGHYRKAIEYDPVFGRAYSGWAIAARGLGRMDESAEAWEKTLELLGSMTEREQLRTLGIYYYGVTRNYQKAIETYEALVEKFPADSVGFNNLAISYFAALDFSSALREGRTALDIYPNDVLTRSNFALYAMYASDFDTAVAEAQKLIERDDIYFKAWLPFAMNALASDDLDGAREAYRKMAAAGDRGASTASLGLADVELYAGNFAAARDQLAEATAVDEQAGSVYVLATKYLALAEAQLALGDRDAALATAARGLALTGAEAISVPAALLRIEAGAGEDALPIAERLAGELQPQSRAYASLIRALRDLDAGRHLEAIDTLSAAIARADLWLLRFYRGRAYLEGGYFAEALDEFQMAQRRRGEATAVFLDDLPSFRYAATLPYWLARAEEGVGMTADAAEHYRRFVARRNADDPLAADARERLASPD